MALSHVIGKRRGHPARRPKAVIADVDGSLCNIQSIRHYVVRPADAPEDWEKDFDTFHQSSADCPPNDWVVDWVVEKYKAGYIILVVTGRDQIHYQVTKTWLDKHVPVPFDGPFHRPEGNRYSDVSVKSEIYHYLSRTYDIRFAIDDNPSIIQLWESLGIPVTTVPGWFQEEVT